MSVFNFNKKYVDNPLNVYIQKPQVMDEEIKCRRGHNIKGYEPKSDELQYDGTVCDCEKFIWKSEVCGCIEPHLELRMQENPNYNK